MSTQPVIPHAIYRVKYTAAGLAHAHNFRVFFRDPVIIGVLPTIRATSGPGADRDANDFGTYWWTKVSPVYQGADTFDSYEVWDVRTNPPALVFAATVGLPGTHSGGTSQRPESMATVLFRDKANRKCKFLFFAPNNSVIGRHASASALEFNAFVSDMASSTPTGKLQDYVFGRSGEAMLNLLSVTYGANNATERKIVFG